MTQLWDVARATVIFQYLTVYGQRRIGGAGCIRQCISIGGDDKVLDRKEHTHLDDCS